MRHSMNSLYHFCNKHHLLLNICDENRSSKCDLRDCKLMVYQIDSTFDLRSSNFKAIFFLYLINSILIFYFILSLAQGEGL